MSIQTDDIEDTGLSDGDAVAALMKNLMPPAKRPSADEADDEDDENGEDDEPLEVDDQDEEETDDDEEPDDEADDQDEEAEKPTAAASAALTDETLLKVLVDGEETEVSIGSLKRLAGQEASLTKKSQEAELVGGRAAAALQGAIESVLEDLEAYKDTDWLLESRRMDEEEFEWHRANYSRLAKRHDNLMGAARDFETTVGTSRANAIKAAKEEAFKAMPETITGWNDQVYADLKKYAVAQGLPEGEVENISSPAVLKIIHKAMLLDNGKGKLVAEKVNSAPKNVRKGAGRETLPDASAKAQKAFERKAASGQATEKDAINALLGRWGVKGD